jgi:hypothetical protein
MRRGGDMFNTQPKTKLLEFLRYETLGIIQNDNTKNRKCGGNPFSGNLHSGQTCGFPVWDQPDEFRQGVFTYQQRIPCLTMREFARVIDKSFWKGLLRTSEASKSNLEF